MTRILALAVAVASLSLVSCASTKKECSSCTAPAKKECCAAGCTKPCCAKK